MTDDDGYAWPVHRALTEPSLLAGVPRRLAIFLWTTTAGLVFNLNQYWFLAVGARASRRGRVPDAQGSRLLPGPVPRTERPEPPRAMRG